MVDAQTHSPAARFVGSSVVRKEDRRLLTGHGRYVDDITLHGQLHLAFRRSDVASGRIVSIDTSAAEAVPGVVRVFTAETMNPLHGEAWHGMLGEALVTPPPLAAGTVKYAGDTIACVVATTRYIAEDACDLIEVDIETTPAVVDYRSAAEDTEHLVHADWGLTSNAMVEMPFMAVSADLEEAFAAAAHVVEADIEQNRYICVPMETRGANASWDEGNQEIVIYLSGQSGHGARDYYARYLGIPAANITIELRDVGGGFGSKMFVFREENAVVLASRVLNRPVKWIEDRRENLIAAPHSRNEWARARLALDADGTITAIACEAKADVGAYPVCPAAINTALLPGPYKIPRVGFSMAMMWTNTMGKGAYRGPWMFETTVREMMIDLAARDLGMDPVELRRKNLLAASDLPFTSPTGQEFVEISALETLEQAVEMLDYDAFRAEQREARAQGRLLGVGFSAYVEPTTMATPTMVSAGCTVRIESDGRVTAYLGTTSHGQSIETTMAQVVADALGVGYEDVTVVQGTTRGTPFNGGTGGSGTATMAGGAARQAAEVVRDKVLAIAAHQMEAAPEDLQIEAGLVSVKGTPSRSMSVRDVAMFVHKDSSALSAAGIEPSVEATVRFQANRFPTWSNATHVCVVEVDPESWAAKILRYIVSEDCGKMINPRVVEGQIYGGVVQGIGGVLLENFVYDEDGNPLTTTFMDYLLPTTTEIPIIEVGHIETASSTNPGGFKGMGEGGAIGAHAAVANAVGDALHHLGVRVTSTPLAPSDIFALVQAAGAGLTAVPDPSRPASTREGNDDAITDDNFHDPETGEWWEHETIWYWWFNAERRLGAWHYHYIRPNIGVAGGGLFIFDDTAWFHMEVPYYFNWTNTPLPAERDLHDFTFPEGERFQTVTPLEHYRISFRDRDSIDLDLDWRAAGKPWVRVGPQPHTREGDQTMKPRHLDQFGHVTGTLQLHGETIPIDCYAMRDRSWWHLRPELWKRGGGKSTYITCMADPDTAFFGAGPGGFLILDGERRELVSGSVRRERDSEWGFMTRIVVTGIDTEGRQLEAIGTSVSRMAMPISGVAGVCWQSLVRYELNGVEAYGDDQDAWPLNTWAAFRRTQKGLPDGRAGRFGPID